MNEDKLAELAEQVTDEKSFLIFISELIEDRKRAAFQEASGLFPHGPDSVGYEGWENSTIEDYLEAAETWALTTDFGRNMSFPEFELKEASPWRRVASFLMAGIVYE